MLPLLERPMSEVAADLQVTSLTQHSLPFERVVGAALDGSGYWAAFAITWLENGFPLAGHTDALRRVTTDKKRVAQRPRQTAARLLAAHDRRNHPTRQLSTSKSPTSPSKPYPPSSTPTKTDTTTPPSSQQTPRS